MNRAASKGKVRAGVIVHSVKDLLGHGDTVSTPLAFAVFKKKAT